MFREPAMASYFEDPDFQALAARLDAILEEERHKTFQLICFNNPASEVWQPLPETCEGVEERTGSVTQVFLHPGKQQRAWGNDYTHRKYHDSLLSFGSPPVQFVRSLLLDLPIPE